MRPLDLPPTRDTSVFPFPVRSYDLGPVVKDPLDLRHLGLCCVDAAINAIPDLPPCQYPGNLFAFEDPTTKAQFVRLHMQGANPQLIPYPPERLPYDVGDEVFMLFKYVGFDPIVGQPRMKCGTITKATAMHPEDKVFDRQRVWVQWLKPGAKPGVNEWVNDGEPRPELPSGFTLYRGELRYH